jgi:hypothetical protein
MVTASNLDKFKTAALELISGVNTDLQTDQDFADAEKAIKWAKEVEQKLTASKAHALSQTASIDELFRALDEIKETARTTRLTLEKLVKQRKESLKIEIVTGAKNKLRAHIDAINKTLQGVSMPEIIADFAGAIRGKKNLDSMRDAVDTELARSKIEANNVADKMRLNLISLDSAGNDFLFPERLLLALKDPDDLAAIIKSRIADHEKSEADRLEKDREKIREEERERFVEKAEEMAKIPDDGEIAIAHEHRIGTVVSELQYNVGAVKLKGALDTVSDKRGFSGWWDGLEDRDLDDIDRYSAERGWIAAMNEKTTD